MPRDYIASRDNQSPVRTFIPCFGTFIIQRSSTSL
jgi:hypothetical protein